MHQNPFLYVLILETVKIKPCMKRIIITIQFIFLLLPVIFGQDPEKKQYTATQITIPPVIDGILNEESWQSGTWADGFTQNQPYNGRPETQRTEFKILFDENNLYVAIKAYDTSPDSIVNRNGDHYNVDENVDGKPITQ